MGPIVDGNELVERDVGVALGGRKARVAEQFLNGAKVGAALEQMGRAGMAKRVWMQIATAGAERTVALNERLDAPDSESRSVATEK